MLLLVVILAAVPFLLASYPVSLGGRILAFALVVVSTDLLTGVTGMPTLAQVGYFGVGAYSAGLVGIHWTDNLIVQLAVGTLAAGLLALVTGVVAVRTAGIVFLMVTLAIGELIHQVADRLDFLGASNGLVGIPAGTLYPGGEPLILAGYTYWWALLVFLLGLTVAYVVAKSPLGLSMRAVRESPTRLRAVGQSTYVVRLVAFIIAGAIAGAAGTAWTAQTRFVSPGDLAFSVSALALLSVVLGGAGTLWGPAIGAAVVFLTRDWLAANYFTGHADLLLGIVFVLAVFLLPRGIAGYQLSRRSDPPHSGAAA
ncbi:branched-chain amino acid ABC transporter permease [Segeticoccus rhizosphaerae]|uniref:branched-chain amino acid ABC transporter permease n=1 Tax=Segeticoccus rhizosphaerae TaxID=1104777 RepID=UPI001396867A|nr:branched-chain amino acid ABC transporter permease [Segeticoccus rhizosphaerae]